MKNAKMLGAAIRSYRLRKRQAHNEKPWTLEDLAVATNDDKSHLSRVERGRVSPTHATLLRLASALDLTRPEADYLLRLGGFQPIIDLPCQEDAAKAIRWMTQRSRNHLNPLALVSVDLRVWYCNALWLRLMGISPAQFRHCFQGRHFARNFYLEQCSTMAVLKDRYSNRDEMLQRTALRFRGALIDGLFPQGTLDQLLDHDTFRSLWEAVKSRLPQSSLTGEQSFSELKYPGRGILRFDTWWCPLEIDHRFMVMLQMPHDAQTRDALLCIRSDPRPGPGAPCLIHGYMCKRDGRQLDPQLETIRSDHGLAEQSLSLAAKSRAGLSALPPA